MRNNRRNPWHLAVFAGAALLATATIAGAAQAPQVERAALEIAQAGGTQPRELEPRYQPVPPEEKSWYNTGYFFALTGGVAQSTMAPAAKVLLYPLTVPLDLVLLPFAAIGGLFG